MREIPRVLSCLQQPTDDQGANYSASFSGGVDILSRLSVCNFLGAKVRLAQPKLSFGAPSAVV